jgi:hypothetical protein
MVKDLQKRDWTEIRKNEGPIMERTVKKLLSKGYKTYQSNIGGRKTASIPENKQKTWLEIEKLPSNLSTSLRKTGVRVFVPKSRFQNGKKFVSGTRIEFENLPYSKKVELLTKIVKTLPKKKK